ncbi:hypothetical protein [Streptomyces sp. PTY087I2]|uniref:hypothetical protein n=1 Tax=Streptomyces sp. PTY087I2 TaxID=1819298 RepID=UPI00080B8521|nr:hypothetical protein [Streptomyces sp. PTY087I2]OCC11385.1 hypothetical protein A3Q37_02581 [Streptomyces sp. PTY087I2]
MRKIRIGASFAMAAILPTGCGSEEPAKDSKAEAPAAEATTGTPKAPGGSGEGEGTPHEVTIEVEGTGASTVMYTLDDSDFEQITLPWKKTATIAARGAEREVGRLVILTPGHMTLPDGKLGAAPCSITVDGKKVVESKEGKPCSYKLK